MAMYLTGIKERRGGTFDLSWKSGDSDSAIHTVELGI